MLHTERLDDTTFLLYAAKHYSNFDTQEFYEDLNLFKYILRLFNRYRDKGEMQERLLLNHIIIVYNIWGIPAATRMLFYRLEGHESALKSFLVYLNCMPDVVNNIGPFGKTYKYSDIQMDEEVFKRLQKI